MSDDVNPPAFAFKRRPALGTDIWVSDPKPGRSPHVEISLYGTKAARLFAGSGDCDHLWVNVGDHTLLTGPVYCWVELAEVLNEALKQHRLYLDGLDEDAR
jgi:hypothetical protein